MVEGPTTVIAKTTMLVCSEMSRILRKLGYCPTHQPNPISKVDVTKVKSLLEAKASLWFTPVS